jgi:hypothetical protein
MNFVYEITSEISGATDPPRLDKFKIKKMKMAILDTGGKFKITVMSLWIKVIIQPIPEQIVRKMDLIHNSKFTAGMHGVILLLTKKEEFQCNVLLAMEYDIKGGTLLPLRSFCNEFDVTVIPIPLQIEVDSIIPDQIVVFNVKVKIINIKVEIEHAYGSILPEREDNQWKLISDITGGTQSLTPLYFSLSYVLSVFSANQGKAFDCSNNLENYHDKKNCEEIEEINRLTLLLIMDYDSSKRMLISLSKISQSPVLSSPAPPILLTKEQIFSPIRAMDENSLAILQFYSLMRSIVGKFVNATRKIITSNKMREDSQSLLMLHGMSAHLERSNKILMAVEASSSTTVIETVIILSEPPLSDIVLLPKSPDVIFTGRQLKNNEKSLLQTQMVLDHPSANSFPTGSPFLHTSVEEEESISQQFRSVTAPELSVTVPSPPNE